MAGGAVQLSAKMTVAGVKEQVQVTAETPVIDTKKTSDSTNVTLAELQNVPTARDPWVVLQTVPSIIVDRVNVGGSESGQQSGYQAKGAVGRRRHVEHGRHPDHRHGGDGRVVGVLRLRHVPGDERDDRRLGHDELDGRRPPELRARSRARTRRTGRRASYFENDGMQSNNMDPTLATNLGSPNGKGNRTQRGRGLRVRGRRADHQGPAVGLGLDGQDGRAHR